MCEVSLRVDSAQCERIIPPLDQSVHDGDCGPIPCPRDLALHPLVVVSVRVAKLINLMSQDPFEPRLRTTQLPPETLIADVGQNRVREGVRTDLDAVRIHLSRLTPGDGTEFFGRRLGYRHTEREGETLDRLFLRFIWKSLDDRVDAFRGVAARCRPVQFYA